MNGNGEAQGRTIETQIPARLDRLPWSRFHWMIVIGLGTVWILDGLEVTIVSSISGRLTEEGAGLTLDPSQIGTAAAFYVAGACIGALFFGQLTDRLRSQEAVPRDPRRLHRRRRSPPPSPSRRWYFFIARFFTGAGIGGEYAAINSAIDELIPARVRGRVDLIINGSYWMGAAAGALASIALLDTALFAANVGWRLAFVIGATLGVGILLVRRNVPESPRWLFIHGREDEAEAIVGEIEERSPRADRRRARRAGGLDRGPSARADQLQARSPAPRSPNTRAARSSGSRSSSARPSSTTPSPSTSGPCSVNSSASPRARSRSTSRSSRSPTSSGRSPSAASSTRSAANRWSPAPISARRCSPPRSASS